MNKYKFKCPFCGVDIFNLNEYAKSWVIINGNIDIACNKCLVINRKKIKKHELFFGDKIPIFETNK